MCWAYENSTPAKNATIDKIVFMRNYYFIQRKNIFSTTNSFYNLLINQPREGFPATKDFYSFLFALWIYNPRHVKIFPADLAALEICFTYQIIYSSKL